MPVENFTYDWARFVKRININAPVSAVYQAWATRHGLETWFLRQALFTQKNGSIRDAAALVQPTDTYAWLWHGYGDDTVEHGTILEANGTNTLTFTFGQAGTVTVTIKTEQDETIVELAQQNIPADEKAKVYYHLGCSTGWVFYLTNLKSILEGGLDLRNKNVGLKNVVSA
jgi:uncharacterized protein YndB with AHSA1/START domain